MWRIPEHILPVSLLPSLRFSSAAASLCPGNGAQLQFWPLPLLASSGCRASPSSQAERCSGAWLPAAHLTRGGLLKRMRGWGGLPCPGAGTAALFRSPLTARGASSFQDPPRTGRSLPRSLPGSFPGWVAGCSSCAAGQFGPAGLVGLLPLSPPAPELPLFRSVLETLGPPCC